MDALDYTARNHLGQRLHTAETLARSGRRRLTLGADAVVVGSGPGGLCAAHVLAEAGLSVVVFEAGRFWPMGSFERDQLWANEHLYQENASRVARGNAVVPVASGKGVGGGTLVNSGISLRAPDRVLDEWCEDFGTEMWADDRRDDLYERVEEAIGVSTTREAVAGGNSEVARRGFEGLGVEHGYMPRNTPGCAGCGTCQTGCPVGGKASADLNWLPELLRNGGEVYADTRVETILTRDDRAVGVRGVTRHPETEEALVSIEARAEHVVLAAGAIFTPMMLQRQGFATSNDWVGRNLHIHPANSVMAFMPDDVVIWQGATQGYYAHHPSDPGIIAETYSGSLQTLFTPAAPVGPESMDFLRNASKLAACGSMIRDSSSGRVEIGDRWRASIDYHVDPEDEAKIQRGLRFLAEMFFEAGAERVQPLVAGADFWEDPAEVERAIDEMDPASDTTLYASHPMGTCRMSPDPERGVVRPSDGRLHDVEGLHVTDASVLPTALGVNPQLTIMGTALALARGIVDEA